MAERNRTRDKVLTTDQQRQEEQAVQTNLTGYDSFTDFVSTETQAGLADVIFGKEDGSDKITFKEFVSNLDDAAKDVAGNVLRAVPRAATSFGLTVQDALTGNDGGVSVDPTDSGSELLNFVLGDEEIKSFQTSAIGFDQFAQSTGTLTETEDKYLPALAALGVTTAAVTDSLNPGKKSFTKALSNSNDLNTNLKILASNIGTEVTNKELRSLAEQTAKLTDEAAIDALVRKTLFEVKSNNVLSAVGGRAPGADGAKVATNLNNILNEGGRVDKDGFVDIFVTGSKDALTAAKKTGQLNDLQVATTKALKESKVPGEVSSKVRVPIEKVDYDITGTLKVADDAVSFRTRTDSITKRVEEVTGVSKSPDDVQDSLNLKAAIDELRADASGKGADKKKSIQSVQASLVNMVSKLPIRERGKFLKAIKNTTSTKQLVKQADRVLAKQRDFAVLQKELRNKNSIKSNLAYIKKAGEFNQTMVTDVKKSLGIEGPINKLTLKELQDINAEFKNRLKFKQDRGYLSDGTGTGVPASVYDEAAAGALDSNFDFRAGMKEAFSKPRELVSDFDRNALQTLSLAIKRIDPKLTGSLRRMESNIKTDTGRYHAVLKSAQKGFKTMSKPDRAVAHLAMMNGDANTYLKIAKKYDMEKEFSMLRKALDHNHKRLSEVGYDFGYKENYFPRMISDRKGLLKYLDTNDQYKPLRDGIKELESKLGRPATEMEMAKLMNTLFRGYKTNNVTLSLGSIGESRKIDVIDSDLAKFYHDPLTSTAMYFGEASEKFHMAKLLGKMGGKNEYARYKTAEDFIQSKKFAYHGTLKSDVYSIESNGFRTRKEQEKGTPFDDDRFFGDVVYLTNHKQQSVRLAEQMASKRGISTFGGGVTETVDVSVSGLRLAPKPTGTKSTVEWNDAIQKLKDSGYDGILEKGNPGDWSIIWNKEKLKTKSQLKKEWEINHNKSNVNLENLDDTIGQVTLKLFQDGKATEKDMLLLSRALKARANYAPSSGAVQAIKNASYIQVLNDVGNTLTQFGDLWMSIHHHGARNTAVAFKRGIMKQNEYDTYQLGINQIAEEMGKKGLMNAATEKMFKYIGFQKVDFLGKESFVNAAIMDYRKAAKKGKGRRYDLFKERVSEYFDEAEFKQLEKDLINGDDTELVRLMAVSDILRVQPIAKSEMPLSYLEHPNGRVLYTLKTWGIKQLSHMREEALDGQRRGDNPGRIAANIASIAGGMALLGAGTDEIRDWIYGRENPWKESFTDNLLGVLFLSKYDGYTFEQKGILGLFANKLLPPQPLIDSLWKDVKNDKSLEESKSVRYIPFLGDIYYYRLGAKAEKEEEKESNRDRSSRVRDKTTGGRDRSSESEERVRDR